MIFEEKEVVISDHPGIYNVLSLIDESIKENKI